MYVHCTCRVWVWTGRGTEGNLFPRGHFGTFASHVHVDCRSFSHNFCMARIARSSLTFPSCRTHYPRQRPAKVSFLSSSAYQGKPGDGKLGLEAVTFLPLYTYISHTCDSVTTQIPVKVRAFETPDDFIHSMSWMNQVIREGKTWPFEDEFQSLTEFQGYFTSHAAFVVRRLIPPSSPCLLSTRLENNTTQEDDLMGCFYIKPNFPGRCSHICNGGFITAPMYRGMGVGKLMGKVYLKLAKSLGYKSSYFNLVFESNVASVRLWESLGFQRVARLERAARLKGLKENEILWDTALGYRYDLESFQEEKDYLEPIPWLKQDIVLK